VSADRDGPHRFFSLLLLFFKVSRFIWVVTCLVQCFFFGLIFFSIILFSVVVALLGLALDEWFTFKRCLLPCLFL